MVRVSPLAAFVSAAAARSSEAHAEELQRGLTAHDEVAGGGIDQARAVLSAAANALPTSLGNRGRVSIRSGDDAFDELQIVRSNSISDSQARAASELTQALDFATEHLGPFAGGRPGAFKDPMKGPAIVEEIEPTHNQLVEMAEHAGRAVGILGAAGALDPGEVLRSVLAEPMI